MKHQTDIFLSYRREGGDMTAMYIYQALKDRGYDVFYDLEVLRSGKFNEALLEYIQSCKDFIVVLSPGALDRCGDEGDWVRREIAEAIKQKKNIIPVMMNGFTFPDTLPEDIDAVRFHTGLTSTTEYFQESMNRLCERFLTAKPKKKAKWILPAAAVAVVVIAAVLLLNVFTSKKPTAAPTPVPAQTMEAEAAAPASVQTEVPVSPDDRESLKAQPVAHTDFPVLSAAIEANDASEDYEIDENGAAIEYEQKWPAMGNPNYTRDCIRSITFLPSADNVPEDAWDVSAQENRTVLAWVVPNEESEGLYDLFVAAEGGVKILDAPGGSQLFSGYSSAESISFNGCVDLSDREDFGHLFWGCHSLTEIDFSGVCTESARGMNGMFGGCWVLPELDLSFMDTHWVTDMAEMFLDCGELKTLDLTGFDTSRVRMMNDMFFNCEQLKHVDVSGFDTSRTENMHAMFYRCLALEELDVSGWNTSQVRDFSATFSGCEALDNLELSGFDTRSAEYMNSMFEGSNHLKLLDIKGFDTSNVKSMAWMFCMCRGLDELDLTGWNTANVTDMSNMFNFCDYLYKLDLTGFDTGAVEDMSYMFAACSRLKEVLLTGWNVDNVQSMKGMFSGCASLESIGRDPEEFGHGDTGEMFDGCERL